MRRRARRQPGLARRGVEVLGLEQVSIRTDWDLATGYPKSRQVDVVDTGGRPYNLTGTIISACIWHTWSNAEMVVCLACWECDGRVGHGDSQLAIWTDFAQLRSESGTR